MPTADIRGIDIGMLRTFDALMRERSVSRAAKRLFLSQPAVSASLNRLRASFGDPLFTRTAHGVLPTERALAMAPRIERLLAELSQLLEGDRAFDPAHSQRIFRIGGTDHASRWVLPSLARQLATAGSSIRLFWEPASFSTMRERLHKGEIDLALLPRTKAPADMAHTSLYSDRYVLAARRGHPRFAAGATLDTFCDCPHVFFGYGSSTLDDLIDAELASRSRRRLTQVAVTTFGQIVDVLVRTDHIAVLPGRVALAHADSLDQHELPFAVPDYAVYLCWDRRSDGDAGVQWLKAEVVRRACSGAEAGAGAG